MAWAYAELLKDRGRVPGGESRRHVARRVGSLLVSLPWPDAEGPVILVSHGDTISAMLHMLGTRPSTHEPVTNGAVIALRRHGDTRRGTPWEAAASRVHTDDRAR